MKHYYSFLTIFFAGSMLASAAGTSQKLSLNVGEQTKLANLDKREKPGIKKTPAAESSETEWTLLGTGKYTDDILTNTGLESKTWDVQIYESKDTPGFYRVENPYGNGNCPYFEAPFESCDFMLHAEVPEHVWMEYVELKNIDFGLAEEGEYCPGYTGDYAGYYISQGYFDAETAIAMGMASGTMLGGNITFEPETLILDFPHYGQEGLSLAANLKGKFCVSLPGASDFKFSIENTDICTDTDLTIKYSAGADIAEVKYDIYPGMLSFETTDEDLFSKVKAEGKTASGGSVNVAPKFGINTVAFAAIAPNGDIVGKKTFYCFGQQANANEWKSIGKAEYSEDVLASIYPNDVDNVKYEVDIEESVSTPGRYRIADLYGPAYPYYQNLVDDENILTGHTHHHYTILMPPILRWSISKPLHSAWTSATGSACCSPKVGFICRKEPTLRIRKFSKDSENLKTAKSPSSAEHSSYTCLSSACLAATSTTTSISNCPQPAELQSSSLRQRSLFTTIFQEPWSTIRKQPVFI